MRSSFFNFLLALPAVLAAPVLLETRQEDNIAGSWIVKVNQNAALADVLSQVTQVAGVQPTHQYSFGSFQGFSIDAVSDAVGLLGSITSIETIEPNTRVYANAIQANPPYGLARISHRNAGATEYVYDDSAGAGTFAYIIDTGIYTQHNDFGGKPSYISKI